MVGKASRNILVLLSTAAIVAWTPHLSPSWIFRKTDNVSEMQNRLQCTGIYVRSLEVWKNSTSDSLNTLTE